MVANAKPVTVSFIIPTWNRLAELKNLVQSLDQQRRRDFEVWVVDNGSKDGTADYVRSLGPPYRLIANPKNLGPAAARNQAIVNSRGRYLWFLDSDSVLNDPEVLDRGVGLMEKHPWIGAAGGEINEDPDGGPVYRVKLFRTNGETRNLIHRNREVRLERCDYLPTCNCLTRKELVYRWGGFDPDYFISAEDCELGVAIRKMGFANVFDSRLTVVHRISHQARAVDLYTKNRNRLRFVLLTGSVGQVMTLPLQDLRSLLSQENVQSVSRAQENPQVYKYLRGWMRQIVDGFIQVKPLVLAAVGAEYGTTLALAYLHNLAHLHKTLVRRFQRPDFLARAADGEAQAAKGEM